MRTDRVRMGQAYRKAHHMITRSMSAILVGNSSSSNLENEPNEDSHTSDGGRPAPVNDSVIDLTDESFEGNEARQNQSDQEEIIDLTQTPRPPPRSPPGSLNRRPVLINRRSCAPTVSCRHMGIVRKRPPTAQTVREPQADQNQGDDIEDITPPQPKRASLDGGNVGSNTAEKGDGTELLLHCLVCLDEFQEIKKDTTRRIVSTACGHLFCDKCMEDVMVNTKCCPMCRKRLTKPSIRPIFI